MTPHRALAQPKPTFSRSLILSGSGRCTKHKARPKPLPVTIGALCSLLTGSVLS